MNSYNFIEHNIPSCLQLNLEDGRRYRTPEGKEYPSVTRVLGAAEPSPYLTEWIASVGKEEANRIMHRAAVRGTKLHEACENHLLGKPTEWGMFDGEAQEMFKHCLPLLDRINNIHAIETGMWSDRLKVAGTTDLIAEIDGELSVQDWKSSTRYKGRDEIDGYFMQGSCYAYMFYERTGILVKRMDIHISSAEHGLISYSEKVSDWLPKFMDLRKKFLHLYGF